MFLSEGESSRCFQIIQKQKTCSVASFEPICGGKSFEVSPYSAVQTRYLHEGRAMKITRADQSESTSGLEQLTAHLEIKLDEIENLTFQKAIEKHDAMIADLVQEQTHFIRERMCSELPESQTLDVGNVSTPRSLSTCWKNGISFIRTARHTKSLWMAHYSRRRQCSPLTRNSRVIRN